MARRAEREVQGASSALLRRLNRQSSANILIDGGTESQRVAVARRLHASSRLVRMPFCATNARRDHERLTRALHRWLGLEDGAAPFECSGGTLYVEDPGELSPLAQRLFVKLAERLDGTRLSSCRASGPARLAAGGPRDLAADVSSGRLLASLHDSLDKLRVRLDEGRRVLAR